MPAGLKKIVLASDHAGFTLKAAVADHLRAMPGRDVIDIGTYSTNPVDYPPICAAAARMVISGEADFAIVMGGSGQGEQIAANKVRGVRAALCHDEYTARFARLHNDANVLSLGARITAPELACAILDVFLETEFEARSNQQQLKALNDVEFGYEAPKAEQYIEGERQLVALGMERAPGAPAPIRVASAADGDEQGAFPAMVSPLTGKAVAAEVPEGGVRKQVDKAGLDKRLARINLSEAAKE